MTRSGHGFRPEDSDTLAAGVAEDVDLLGEFRRLPLYGRLRVLYELHGDQAGRHATAALTGAMRAHRAAVACGDRGRADRIAEDARVVLRAYAEHCGEMRTQTGHNDNGRKCD